MMQASAYQPSGTKHPRPQPAGSGRIASRILCILLCFSGASAGAASLATPEIPAMNQSLSQDIAHFGWRMQRQIGETGGNTVFSPLSVASVFAMLGAGARGETRDEIRSTFSVSLDEDDWHAAQGELLRALLAFNREGTDYRNALTLRVVNDLWLQQGLHVGSAFLATLETQYASLPQALDFAADPEAARVKINARIAQHTEDLIRELLPQGSIGADARLVLANALYFKAAWATPFKEGSTSMEPFHAIDGSVSELPSMQRTGHFDYAEGEGWQAIRLPYEGDELELLVLLPESGRFSQFAAELDAERVESLIQSQQRRRVRLGLPTFSLRGSLPLVEALQRAGLRRVFSDQAELGGIGDRLFVSAAMHEAVVAVDEAGTEAAAATAAVISLTSMPMEQDQPVEMQVDRPFLFAVRVAASGLPLFIGQLVKP